MFLTRSWTSWLQAALTVSNIIDDAHKQHPAKALEKNTRSARELLDRAGEAHARTEAASIHNNIAGNSASMVMMCDDESLRDDLQNTEFVVPMHARPPGYQQPKPLFNARALQLWILGCCQSHRGGLRDKPGKGADYYHTCYCLSGLSLAQHCSGLVLGPRENLLCETDAACNVLVEKLAQARAFFAS